jgi:hypothetical protein
MAAVVSGGAAAIPAGLAGIVAGITKYYGLTEASAADVVRSVQEALTYKPVTEGGQTATEWLTSPLTMYAQGSEDLGGSVSDKLGPLAGTVVNTAMQGVPALFGAKSGGNLTIPPRTQSFIETKARAGIAGVIEKHIDPHLPGGKERAAARIFREVTGDKAAEVAAALENQPPNKLNIPQTAGQVAADVGSAEFSALENILEKHRPTPFAAQDLAAAEARKAAIRQVGKTPEELAAAIKAREAKAATAYGEAFKETVKNDAELQGIIDIVPPKALREARDLAKLERQDFRYGTEKAPVQAYPVRTLHYIKLGLDKLIQNPEQYGIGGARKAALVKLKTQLVERIAKSSAKYEEARAGYAADSAPINQMKIGQELEAKLSAPIGVGERASAFAAAVKEPPAIIKKSTGQSRYKELSEVMTPQQMEVIDALMDNLRKDARFEDQSARGMFSAQERLKNAIPYIPPPGMFSPVISVGRGWINRLSAASTDSVLHLLADITKNPTPENVNILLRKATAQEKAAVRNVMMLRNRAFVGAAVAGSEQQESQ